jgi:glyoxylase-like metal-dependent hydrolase (beta-lactamase superfamily II)
VEIVAGVHRIALPFPSQVSGSTNVYVVEGDRGHILVDSGFHSEECLWSFREGLRASRLKFQDIRWIVITHIHPDHYGLAAKLKELCGAELLMHKVEANLVESRYRNPDPLLKRMEQELRSNGVPESELSSLKEASLWMRRFVAARMPDCVVSQGDRISNGSLRFEVLHTPGHSPGHICLYEQRKRWLFSGDHVIFDTVPHVGYHAQAGEDPLGDYLSSLEELQGLGVSFVFPGHGPTFNSLKLRVADIRNHHGRRRKAVAKALDGGLKTAYEVACEIPWKLEFGGMAFQDLEPWDRRLAVFETIAQLRSLTLQGRAGTMSADGVCKYLSKD